MVLILGSVTQYFNCDKEKAINIINIEIIFSIYLFVD